MCPAASRSGLRLLCAAFAIFCAGDATRAAGTIPLTAFGGPYTQNFNTLAASGTSATVPLGWEFAETGTNADPNYTAGAGAGNSGDTYSFGADGSSERAFGGLQSGSLVPTIGASFSNDTGVQPFELAGQLLARSRAGGHMTQQRAAAMTFILLVAALSAGCQLVIDIFQAGMAAGLILVLLVLAAIVWAGMKLRKK